MFISQDLHVLHGSSLKIKDLQLAIVPQLYQPDRNRESAADYHPQPDNLLP
jgi:hypothetical protein